MPTIKDQVVGVATTLNAIVANWSDTTMPPPVVVPGVEGDPRSDRAKRFDNSTDS